MSLAAIIPIRRSELQLTAGQQQAFDLITAAANGGRREIPFAVITGYAGTGKTTLLRLAKSLRPLLIAPTGKAALRLQEATGQKASTIHRAFKQAIDNPADPDGDPLFLDKSAEVPLGCKVILVDESSMVTEELAQDIQAHAARLNLPVVFIGDPFQLPPVSPPGAPPYSVLKLETPHRVELTQVLRQAEDNPIIAASMRIRAGHAALALRAFTRVPFSGLAGEAASIYQRGGATICYRNATRFSINRCVRRQLGLTDVPLVPTEPLLVTFNNYRVDLFNGEIARFAGWSVPPRIFQVDGRGYEVGVATLESGKQVWLCLEGLAGVIDQRQTRRLAREISHVVPDGFEEPPSFLQANYGYALTAHKSQGSEWPDILVVLEPSLRLNTQDGLQWLYTAVTRARATVRIGSWG